VDSQRAGLPARAGRGPVRGSGREADLSSTDYEQIRSRLRTAYDRGAGYRDQLAKQDWKLAERAAFLARLQAGSCVRLLEIGAGTGQDSLFFAEHGLEVIATDASAQMAARCRSKGLTALVMDFSRPAFADCSFDAVHAMNCLLHVPDAHLPAVLRQIARMLTPGGLFFLGVYGGRDEEGVMADDDHVPARFFSWRSDEQLVAVARESFDVADFHVAEAGTSYRFQSLTLYRTSAGSSR
jgi:SAM-dependent methyltransferase